MTIERDREALSKQRGTDKILCRFRRYRTDEPHPILPYAPHPDHQYVFVPFDKLDETLARFGAIFGDQGADLQEAA